MRAPVLDEATLLAVPRRAHRIKVDIRAIIRVLEGRLRHGTPNFVSKTIHDPDPSGLLIPDQPHMIQPPCPMRLAFCDFIHKDRRIRLSVSPWTHRIERCAVHDHADLGIPLQIERHMDARAGHLRTDVPVALGACTAGAALNRGSLRMTLSRTLAMAVTPVAGETFGGRV